MSTESSDLLPLCVDCSYHSRGRQTKHDLRTYRKSWRTLMEGFGSREGLTWNISDECLTKVWQNKFRRPSQFTCAKCERWWKCDGGSATALRSRLLSGRLQLKSLGLRAELFPGRTTIMFTVSNQPARSTHAT